MGLFIVPAGGEIWAQRRVKSVIRDLRCGQMNGFGGYRWRCDGGRALMAANDNDGRGASSPSEG